MGTRGYRVYHYRNMYFPYYHHLDSYPHGLGVKILNSMRSPHAITSQKQELKEIFDEWDGSSDSEWDLDENHMASTGITSKRPKYGIVDAEWIYEIDLDHNIFHVNGIPFYSLECLPDDDDFLEHISEDHYEKLACAPGCPPQYKYKRPIPPVVGDSDLATYQSLVCTGPRADLSDLLATSHILTPNEQVRVSLLEMMIGQCIILLDFVTAAELIYELDISHHTRLADENWSAACSMANLAFVPQIFDGSSGFVHHLQLSRKEFTWVREDTVVCIATHLDDERCLQASISRLINAILEQQDVPGDYFGVAFSVAHCAIIKVVKHAHTTTFSHTAALQFVPSPYADSPSTPGITALARLGYRVDPAIFVRATEICRWRRGMKSDKWRSDHNQSFAEGANDAPPSVSCAVLPPELWQEIALYLGLQDILSLGLVSKLCREAASTTLRYPHVCGHRLVAVSKEMPECLLKYRRFLYAASFSTAQVSGIPAPVVFGFRPGVTFNIPFSDSILSSRVY
ncbi:hypothetical protein DFH29DRAFT_852784 [Suillus ampliporus]|nr:hypothetical protein DFH29DRAFT_852784 [Suillus ampliporus]